MTSFYDDEHSLDAYLAHRHADVTSPNLVMEDPAFRAEVGEVDGLDILDLGCGDGTYAAKCLADGCASFIGVDAASGMIDRAKVTAPGATFSVASMEALELDADAHDLVVSRMALHYVADLDPVLREVRVGLRPGGRFVFSVIHPVLTASLDVAEGQRTSVTVDNYFNRGDRNRSWFGSSVTWQHRNVEDYVAAVLDAGFELSALRECEPVEDLFDGDIAELERRRRVPVFLLLAGRAVD